MITYHHMPDAQFADLASGLGGPEAVYRLANAQHSKHLLLLRHLTDAWSAEPACQTAVDVLVEAERSDPHALTELLSDPMVGAWAVRTTRQLAADASAPADLAQLGALAAVAAFLTRLDAEVVTHTRGAGVTLPTLGSAVLDLDAPATVTVSAGRATVSGGPHRVEVGAEGSRWHGLRRLVARYGDLAGSLAVEDGNPYRDCYHAPPADRLTADEVARWQDLFTEAWELLVRYVPARAAELAAGLRSLVPLVTDGDGVARSGTARDAFGTLGLTRPRSATELAVTLVHEFQHSKLSVLLDLAPLYAPAGGERHFAPWRTDARPTAGLIQGVYAFLGVADTWRALRSAPELEELATREFAVVRRQVAVGLHALERSAELTPKGREFAAGLRKTLDGFLAVQVPMASTEAATEVLARREHAWRQHNPGLAGTTPTNR
ncbi:HEXXH motif domain-containing protein [Phytohabitans kaempferiae]|uniref:HEXXH motif domain-containing protein n=1 Tax=Phytohabitans kaempferiae TaxID=1620943 RepID=A0ABV6M2L8_9ACTN